MARDSALNVSVGIIAAIMICVAASQASAVFAPLALALFIIALVWPLQSWLQARMPALLALAITMSCDRRGVHRLRLAHCMGLWPRRRVADRRFRALSGALRARDRLARRPRDFRRRPMERAFQRQLASALGGPDHRPRQHDSQLLADRPALRHLGPDGSRRSAPARAGLSPTGNRPDPPAGERGDGGEDPQVYGSAHADERRDRRSRRPVRLGRSDCPSPSNGA